MKVLLTNNTLATRAGTELFTLELASGLLARGHRPVAFSSRLGEMAEELRRRTVPVVDDLGLLAEPPDLIHAQHHLEALIALLHFPGVPAIYVCHGWLPWEETPPLFPRFRRYVAVDETTRDRLAIEAGIPAARIEVILNAVDLARFVPRGPLPARPRRALVFSNQAHDETQLPAVRAACAQAGLAVDVLGIAAGTAATRPEEILGAYDLVFAKGRAALEAMAVGIPVVLCDARGAGPLVTAERFDRLRPLNFGIRALQGPLDPAALAAEIARYDPADAAAVRERVRGEAGLEGAVERYLALYGRVLAEDAAEAANGREAAWSEEARALSAYLRWLAPELKERGRSQAENAALRDEVGGLRSELARLHDDNANRRAQSAALEGELAALQGTATWRWRERLVGSPAVRRAYRWLRGLPPQAT